MPLFPGHNYLGPGNPLPNGEPVDEDDAIAREHDYAYAAAKTKDDIRKADQIAIQKFSKVNNWHATVGATGLRLKNIGESFVGEQLYPDPQDMQRGDKRPKHISPDSTPKKQKPIPPLPPLPTDSTDWSPGEEISGTISEMPNTGQPGSSVAGGAGASVVQTSPLTCPRNESYKKVYRRNFQLYTAGFQFWKTNCKEVNDALGQEVLEPTHGAIHTPLAVMDPGDPALYMNMREFMDVSNTEYATHCKIKITPLGYRLPFATNDATSTYANSQTLIQIGYGIALENSLPVFVSPVTTADADHTKINGYTTFASDDILYSKNANDGLGANIGIPRHWNRYAHFLLEDVQWDLDLLRFYKIENVNDVKGMPVIDYSYEFKNGTLAPQWSGNRADTMKNAASFAVAPAGTVHQHELRSVVGGAEALINVGLSGQIHEQTMDRWYHTNIEKASFMNRTLSQDYNSQMPPLLYFGCMPCQSNAALSPTPTFSDVVVQWKVECELHTTGREEILSYTSASYALDFYDPLFHTITGTRNPLMQMNVFNSFQFVRMGSYAFVNLKGVFEESMETEEAHTEGKQFKPPVRPKTKIIERYSTVRM